MRAFREMVHHVEREHAQDLCFTATDLGGSGMNTDLDALATAFYVTIDDLLIDHHDH